MLAAYAAYTYTYIRIEFLIPLCRSVDVALSSVPEQICNVLRLLLQLLYCIERHSPNASLMLPT